MVIVERVLGSNETGFSIKYLEVLIRDKTLKKEDWMEMIKKIQKKKP